MTRAEYENIADWYDLQEVIRDYELYDICDPIDSDGVWENIKHYMDNSHDWGDFGRFCMDIPTGYDLWDCNDMSVGLSDDNFGDYWGYILDYLEREGLFDEDDDYEGDRADDYEDSCNVKDEEDDDWSLDGEVNYESLGILMGR